jgi:uncharacterized protein involved in exopolysaccharide biosynthesis
LRIRNDLSTALSRPGAAHIEMPTASVLDEDDEESSPGISATQISLMLLAHWKVVLITFISILVLGVVAIKLMPKFYTATATLKVDSDVNDPLAMQTSQFDQRGSYIPTEMQLMASNSVLLKVIDQLKLTQDKDYIGGFRGIDTPPNRAEWVKERLLKDLEITQGNQGSLLINITATAKSATLAADIANAVADTYLKEERQRIDNPASERVKRYTEQLGELKAKVTTASDKLAEYRQRTGITDPTGTKNVELETLGTMQQRLEDARNQRREAEVRAAGDPSAGRETGGVRARVDSLKTQLSTQESQLAQLRTTLGPAHPKVIEMESSIEVTRQTINTEMKSFSKSAEYDLAAARQLERKLQDAVDTQRAKVLEAGSVMDEGNKYVLELESAQSVYKRALDGYDQVMFASAGHYTFVDLVSHATPAIRSTKPNKMKLLLMTIVAALGLGVIGPLGYEMFVNRRVRCRDDLERGFKVPVLAELDPIPEASPEPA